MQFGSTEQLKVVLLFVIAVGLVLLNLQMALAFRFSRADRYFPDPSTSGMTAEELSAVLSRCTISAHYYGAGEVEQVGQAHQLDVACESANQGSGEPFLLPPAEPTPSP